MCWRRSVWFLPVIRQERKVLCLIQQALSFTVLTSSRIVQQLEFSLSKVQVAISMATFVVS